MKTFLKIFLILFILTLAGGCSTFKNTRRKKIKKKAILLDTTQNGRNKLFFSKSYHRKLNSRSKKMKRRR
jgi:hypothetical protein